MLFVVSYKKINFSQEVTQDQVKEKVEAELPECFVEGMKGWRIMTTDEGRYVFFPIRQDIPSWQGLTNKASERDNYKYISTQEGNYEYFSIANSSAGGASFTTNKTYVLQPVTTMTLHIIK